MILFVMIVFNCCCCYYYCCDSLVVAVSDEKKFIAQVYLVVLSASIFASPENCFIYFRRYIRCSL